METKRTLSEDHKRKIGESRVLSDETKEKIRQARLGTKTGVPAHNKKEHTFPGGIESKTCSVCKIEKPIVEFGKDSSARWDGLNYACKVCHAARKKKYYDEHPEYQEQLKIGSKESHRSMKLKCIAYKGSKCLDCNLVAQDEEAGLFDFHHRDPKEKDFALSNSRIRDFEKFKTELDKCDLLCKLCHCRRHIKEGFGR